MKLGRVESETQNGQDVTAQYVDLEAGLNNSRNTEKRLLELRSNRTGKLLDVLKVETELSQIREEIERMEGERRLLAKQVEYATLTATVTEEYNAPASALADFDGHALSQCRGRRLPQCCEFRHWRGAFSDLGWADARSLDSDPFATCAMAAGEVPQVPRDTFAVTTYK